MAKTSLVSAGEISLHSGQEGRVSFETE